MATTVSKGSITFKDATQKGSAKIIVKAKDPALAPITTAKLDALADAIALKSDCALAVETVLDIAREDAVTGTGNKDRKGVLVCQENDGTIHKWEIAGIKATDCEQLVGSEGESIKPASATALATAFGTCIGAALVALPSRVIQTR